jgi:hypothetical protein
MSSSLGSGIEGPAAAAAGFPRGTSGAFPSIFVAENSSNMSMWRAVSYDNVYTQLVDTSVLTIKIVQVIFIWIRYVIFILNHCHLGLRLCHRSGCLLNYTLLCCTDVAGSSRHRVCR